MDPIDRTKLSLRGTLLGDSLGLVYEGLTPAKIEKRLGTRELKPAFLAGRAVPSDDAAHAFLTAWALHQSGDDVDKFQRILAGGIRQWFLALPFGIGMATLKAGLKLSIGVRPPKSGVDSAGNGPAMRAPVIGWWFAEDPERVADFVRASTEITHRHPLALQGSLLAAQAALAVARDEPLPTLDDWPSDSGDPRRGPSGYIVHTMNTVFDLLARERDPVKVVDLAVRRGGDTDTIAAITGGIIGLSSVPENARSVKGWPNWAAIEAFPRPPSYLRMLSFHLTCYPVVIGHGFRRLL